MNDKQKTQREAAFEQWLGETRSIAVSEDFTDRTLARIRLERALERPWWLGWAMWTPLAIAAMLTMVFVLGRRAQINAAAARDIYADTDYVESEEMLLLQERLKPISLASLDIGLESWNTEDSL